VRVPGCEEWLKETDIVLIPLGSTEQHGRHLPVCTDSIATELPCQIAAELANVPYYQLIPFGYSPSTSTRQASAQAQ